MHLQALGQQVGAGLVAGAVNHGENAARGATYGFMAVHQLADHFLSLGRGAGGFRDRG